MQKLSVGLLFVQNNTLFNGTDDKLRQNIKFITKELEQLYCKVCKVSVVLMDPPLNIFHELLLFNKLYDWSFIVADAKNPEIFKILALLTNRVLEAKQFDNEEILIPIRAQILYTPGFPITNIQRIYVLHEDFVEMQFDSGLKRVLTLSNMPKQICYFKTYKTRLIQHECEPFIYRISDLIHRTDIRFTETVFEGMEVTKIDIKADDFDRAVKYDRYVKQVFGANDLFDWQSCSINGDVFQSTQYFTTNAIESIKKCFKEFGPENVFISFNGGKDCTALLHLALSVLRVDLKLNNHQPLCLYVRNHDDTFPEQDEFIQQCESYFDLNLVTVNGNIKSALSWILQRKPNLKACLMGSRATDPYCNDLNIFQYTDSDWPNIMRVSPLLQWHYDQIWDYIHRYKVPYCKLYDQGYTSLGGASNTIRNPHLKYFTVDYCEEYLPAYKLLNEDFERDGRNIRKS